jgi:hypothetical protein
MINKTRIASLVALTFSLTALGGQSDEEMMKNVDHSLGGATQFLKVLENHKSELAECKPIKKDKNYMLCDGTSVSHELLKKLFSKKNSELLKFLQNQKINYEILCKESHLKNFRKWCNPNANRSFFKEVTSLHGQYVPAEKTIVIQSDASNGSLIHEYLHYLQHENKNQIYGLTYKSDRVAVHADLLKTMNFIIERVNELEKEGRKEEAKKWIKPAMSVGDTMMKFSLWQKIIDERNLFLLFINFGKELGIKKEDIELAKKNIGFICNDPEASKILNENECKIKK